VSRQEVQRLQDIFEAIAIIRTHLSRGDLSDGLVFDAVRVRLIEIGEAIKALPPDFLASESDIPWDQVAGMRDRLTHRCFDISHVILQATVDEDLPDLEHAVQRLMEEAAPGG
jgi:uncharacterized protein with HEPN domain